MLQEKIHEDENYIEFFQERYVIRVVTAVRVHAVLTSRIRIEEQYIAQLQKLYDRTVAKDSLQDE
jgi:hypothetical protein